MVGETEDENIDFFVFSAHKMYSPYGGGAVVGLSDVLMEHMPKFYGGGTIHIVGDDWVEYAEAPKSYEAGSPNYPGVVGMGKAIDILEEVDYLLKVLPDAVKRAKKTNEKNWNMANPEY